MYCIEIENHVNSHIIKSLQLGAIISPPAGKLPLIYNLINLEESSNWNTERQTCGLFVEQPKELHCSVCAQISDCYKHLRAQ